MLQYTEGDLTLNGMKLHYYRTGGSKPPFLLLHGAGDSGLCWTPIAEALAKDYDVIMPDAQGHGLSDRLDKDFNYKSHAGNAAEFIKQLGINKPVIMGHSMGAGTTVQLAVDYDDLCQAIILEDPGWMPPPPPGQVTEMEKQREGLKEYMIGLSKKTLPELIEECRRTNPLWPETEIKPWAESKIQFDPELFSHMVLDPRSYKELVPRINCPTLLLIAETSPVFNVAQPGLVSREVAEDAAKLWKFSRPFKWVKIKGAGHNIRRENFPDYWAALTSFLKALPD